MKKIIITIIIIIIIIIIIKKWKGGWSWPCFDTTLSP